MRLPHAHDYPTGCFSSPMPALQHERMCLDISAGMVRLGSHLDASLRILPSKFRNREGKCM